MMEAAAKETTMICTQCGTDVKFDVKFLDQQPKQASLEEMLALETDARANLKKAILAAAFLLEWRSDGGNVAVDGFAAFGLAKILQKCAEDTDRLFTFDDVHAVGGDPALLRQREES
jgi:hypothetical protein